MPERLVRGYTVQSCMDYVDTLPEATRAQVYAAVDPASRDREAFDKMGWYPYERVAAYYLALAGTTDGSEEAVRTTLQDCGKWMARNATNSFMRLLMKILTPSVFAKKLPDFWSRDQNFGAMNGAVDGKQLVVTLTDVGGFDHATAVASGFGMYALEAMGNKDVHCDLQGWSLATPAPDSVRIVLTWS